MKKFAIQNLWWIALLISFALLIIHSLLSQPIKIDNISILLLLFIVVSPFLSTIKKIKFGDLEAEISSEEVGKIKKDLAPNLVTSEELAETTHKFLKLMKLSPNYLNPILFWLLLN